MPSTAPLASRLAPPVGSAAEVAVRLEVVCYRPAADARLTARGRDFSSFEARLRQVVGEVSGRARLVFASAAAARASAPAGVFVSPTLPTVVALVDGRLLAQSVGDLPLWELRALIVVALGGR